MDRLRIAVVGVGHLGRHHARILAGMPDVELVGVADTRAEQAEAVAGPLGTKPYTDFRKLAAAVDAVSVVVPTTMHREVAGYFLDRGIPALVEKPLAPSAADAEALNRLAERSGVVLQVGHIERFNPAYEALRNSGVKPKYLQAERLGTYTFRSTDISVVFDLMIHDIDLVLGLVKSPVRSVSALGMPVFGPNEDVAQARIEFQDGTVADLSASRASYQPSRKLRVWSGDGFVSVDFATRQATVLRPSASLASGEPDWDGVDRTKPEQVRDHVFGTLLKVDRSEAPAVDALTLELRDFIESIRHGRRPVVNGSDGVEAVRLAEAIQSRMRAREWGQAEEPARSGTAQVFTSQASPRVPAPKFREARRRKSSRRGS